MPDKQVVYLNISEVIHKQVATKFEQGANFVFSKLSPWSPYTWDDGTSGYFLFVYAENFKRFSKELKSFATLLPQNDAVFLLPTSRKEITVDTFMVLTEMDAELLAGMLEECIEKSQALSESRVFR